MNGEDYCFICKDGGDLRICDFRSCNKTYHPACVGKDSDFLTSDEEFICEWHTCFICKGRSRYYCFCCPWHSFCKGCVSEAEFFPVLRKTKGFCINCLRMAIMIEKNVDVDSDGERADFSDRETYEFLFKDYWEIVKDKEGLTLDKLEEAYAFLKKGLNCKQASLEKVPDEERNSDSDFLGDSDDGDYGLCSPSYSNGASKRIKSLLKEGKSKKNGYMGWGSEALIEFLSSLGKDTSKSLDQFDAAQIVKDYIKQNDLLQKDKKKLVICDDKLKSLFRKSKLKYNRICSLLKKHITENMSSEDEPLFNSEDNSDSAMTKKACTANYVSRIPKRTSEINKRCFASLKPDNIKLIYLKRSLVMDLLKEPDTFESKVTGCFVRVKNDPKDYSYLIHKKSHELRQITGIKKSLEEYKIKDISTDILLCTSDMYDLKISMLSDEDFKEDECDDLCLLAQKGSFKRPTVGDIEEKLKSIHRDIMSHRINKELQRLEKSIEIAHEKGWRRIMYEDMDKKKLLQEPSERRRLLEEVPKVIPDTEDTKDTELQVTAQDKSIEKNTVAFQGTNGERVISSKRCSEEKSKGTSEARAILNSCSEGKSKGTNLGGGFTLRSCSEEKLKVTDGERALSLKSCSEEKSKVGDTPGKFVQKKGAEAVDVGMTAQVITIEDEGDDNLCQGGGQTAVIDLEADDAMDTHPVQRVWYYNDPQGDERGPFTMEHLRYWWDGGYFPKDFKVWRKGQSSDSAVFLRDVLQVTR